MAILLDSLLVTIWFVSAAYMISFLSNIGIIIILILMCFDYLTKLILILILLSIAFTFYHFNNSVNGLLQVYELMMPKKISRRSTRRWTSSKERQQVVQEATRATISDIHNIYVNDGRYDHLAQSRNYNLICLLIDH